MLNKKISDLWKVRFQKNNRTRTEYIACEAIHLSEAVARTIPGRSGWMVAAIHRVNLVHIVESVESQPEETPCPVPTSTIWSASWLPQST